MPVVDSLEDWTWLRKELVSMKTGLRDTSQTEKEKGKRMKKKPQTKTFKNCGADWRGLKMGA